MWNFEEMKLVARQIDQGLIELEKKVENPSLFGYIDEEGIKEKKEHILDNLLMEMDKTNLEILKMIEQGTEEIYALETDCKEIEEFCATMSDNIDCIESHLTNFGYEPPDIFLSSSPNTSNNQSMLCQQLESTNLIQDITPISIESGCDSQDNEVSQLDGVSENTSWRTESHQSSPEHQLNTTFTTPASKYKPRFAETHSFENNFEVSDAFYQNEDSFSSRRAVVKPAFNLDESDRRASIFNTASTYPSTVRRLSKFPSGITSSIPITPPEPEVSALGRRLLAKSAKSNSFKHRLI